MWSCIRVSFLRQDRSLYVNRAITLNIYEHTHSHPVCFPLITCIYVASETGAYGALHAALIHHHTIDDNAFKCANGTQSILST